MAVWRAALRHQLLLTFRDRRTLLMVVALSLLFGAVGARTMIQQATAGMAGAVVTIAVNQAMLPGEMAEWIRRAGLAPLDTANPERAVEQGAAPLGLVLQAIPGAPDQVRARFVARAENPVAMARAGELTALLSLQEDRRLQAQGIDLPPRMIPTLGVVGLRRPSVDELIAGLLTLLVVVPAIGATGAAAELGAGERERKTLEPLLMTPVPPFVLAGAKLAAVLASSLLAAGLAASVQLGLLFWLASQKVIPMAAGAATLPILLLCVTVSVLISGPALLVSLVARSMREATMAMIPLNLASIGLAYLAVSLPPDGMGGGVWYAPGLGALLLVRTTLAGTPLRAGPLLAVLLSTLLLGLGLTWLVGRQLRRETGL